MMLTTATPELTTQGTWDMTMPPKRTLSAYNYFFRSERARLLGIEVDVADVHTQKKRRHRKSHGKISFRDMANQVGARWKNLSDEERAPFVALFEADRARYKAEMKIWNSMQKQKRKEMAEKLEQQQNASAYAEERASSPGVTICPTKPVAVVSPVPPQVRVTRAETADDIIEKALAIMKADCEDMPSVISKPLTFSAPVRNSRKRVLDTTNDFLESALKMMNPEYEPEEEEEPENEPADHFSTQFLKPLMPTRQVSSKEDEISEMARCFDSLEHELQNLMEECNNPPNAPVPPPVVEDFSGFDFNEDFDFLFGQNGAQGPNFQFPLSFPALGA